MKKAKRNCGNDELIKLILLDGVVH